MSVYALAWAKRQIAGGVAAKAVLLVLADYADERGTCWPSQAMIARECELSDRSVRDQLVKLEEAGLVQRETQRRRDGTQASDRFFLQMHSRNDVPADRNVVPVSNSRNVVPEQPEGRSALTTFEPPVDPPTGRIEAREPVLRKRGARFVPESWSPSRSILDYGVTEGLTPGETERALAAMRDHEFLHPKTDWDRTARRWLRTTAERSTQTGPSHERPRPAPAANRRAEGRGVWADLAAEEASAGIGRA